MKLLLCVSEYYPYGSGIANLAYNIVKKLEAKGIECIICSPTGPDIKIGSTKLIKKYGILGLIHFWIGVSRYFKDETGFDAVWYHNPIIFIDNPFDNCLVTMNSTYYGKKLNKNSSKKIQIYNTIASKIENISLNSLGSNVEFIGVGNNVCKELELMGMNKNKIKFVPNGVDSNFFRPLPGNNDVRKRYNIPHENLIFLSVGRLTTCKRPIELIEVFKLVNQKKHNTTLIIVGGGELLKTVQHHILTNNICNIIVVGHLDNKKLPEFYSCSDYFIIASEYEGGEPPLTLSEAMSSGLPCIVSDISNFNVVKTFNCGIKVNFLDAEKSAEKIVKYLSISRIKQSKNARYFAQKYLDWDVIAEEYIKEFSKLDHI